MMTDEFYTGTSEPSWLPRLGVPLFISRRRLARLKTLPRALGCVGIDSGGFTELQTYGGYHIRPAAYAAEARRFVADVGNVRFIAIQDWMCEPAMIKRTGLSVAEHMRRTVESYLELRGLAPELPWLPVVQGWALPDYLACCELYAQAGIDLAALPRVGVGTMCRRQATGAAAVIIETLAGLGLRLHGFGFKLGGLARVGRYLASSDSFAWSYNARRHAALPGCSHKSCANCEHWALRWRWHVLDALAAHMSGAYQPRLV